MEIKAAHNHQRWGAFKKSASWSLLVLAGAGGAASIYLEMCGHKTNPTISQPSVSTPVPSSPISTLIPTIAVPTEVSSGREMAKDAGPIPESESYIKLYENFRKELVSTLKIQAVLQREPALNRLTDRMSKSDLNKIELSDLFIDALVGVSRTNMDKPVIYADIALQMSKASLDEKEVSRLFDEALKFARTTKEFPTSDDLFEESLDIAYIALQMAEANQDRSKITDLFNESLVIARKIKNPRWKASALTFAASHMDKAGLDKNEVAKISKEVAEIKPSPHMMEPKSFSHGYPHDETWYPGRSGRSPSYLHY
ncbi:MAG: hypothetical protein WC624_04920 [Candidatus Margulisiibacteriota bacterium]